MHQNRILRRAAKLGLGLTAIATLLLSGCGGGGGGTSGATPTPTNVTGRFVDATVVGIAYKCGTSTTVSGTTNANGEFTCQTGQTVAFYVGDILLGSATASALVTPLDLAGAGATPSDTKVANIVRFLMSISSTDPATGTITITPAVVAAAAGKTVDFTAASATAIDTLIPTLKSGATVYTSAQATTHVTSSINGLFAGNYAGIYSGAANGNWTITIAADGTVTGMADSSVAISGTMATTVSTGSTYGFTGTAGGTPWAGTLNISTKVFSGTWNDGAGSSGTWTGTTSASGGTGNTAPTITDYAPNTGVAGTTVTITGTNLGLGFQPAPIIKVGATTVTTPLTFNGQTSVSFAVPAGLAAGIYNITIGGLSGTPMSVGTFAVTAGVASPPMPTNLGGASAGVAKIDLWWLGSNNALSYNLYRGTTTGFVVGAASKVNTSPMIYSSGSTFTDTQLSAGTTYYYRVTAVNGSGESAPTAEFSAATSFISSTTIVSIAGHAGYSGAINSPTSTAARFNTPAGVAVDAVGNVYVADMNNHVIRKIDTVGAVTTFAGPPVDPVAGLPPSGFTNGSKATATFNRPRGVAVDAAGNLYVADFMNNAIRKIDTAGMVTTLATVTTPYGIAVDAAGSNVFFVSVDNTVRKIVVATGGITTLATTLQATGVAVDSTGNVYVANRGNYTILKIDTAGVVATFAGSSLSSGSADGTGATARFNAPSGVAVDAAGNVYISDELNYTIRKVTPAGVVTTFAGNAGVTRNTSIYPPLDFVDGAGAAAVCGAIQGIAVNAAGTVVYFSDGNGIRKAQ